MITYRYDAVGQRLDGATDRDVHLPVRPGRRTAPCRTPEAQVTSWLYDAASRVTGQVLANGVQVSNTYDNADRLLLLANLGSGGTTLSSFAYTYNPVGNRTQVVEVDGSVVTWSYDPTYQLTNEQRSAPNSYDITYTYDAVGNRTLLVNNGAPTSYVYNPANEMATSQTSAGVTTYAFDGDGNLLTALAPGNQVTTNTWDGENRLTLVALPSGIVDTFAYNADGQRVQKQDSTGTTNHVWDGQNILLESNAGNIIQVVYTLEPVSYGNLVSASRGAVDSFYLCDGLGSTRELANSAGSVSDSYLYDSFGNIRQTTGSTVNVFRFVGRQGYYYDIDLSIYQLRARSYDQRTVRFLSRDPVSYGPSDLNAYRYVSANPVGKTDPSGLSPAVGVAVGIGVVVTVVVIGGVAYYIWSCSCANLLTSFLGLYGGVRPNPAQANCIGKVMVLLGQVTGRPKYYADCNGNIYVGAIPPGANGNPIPGSTYTTNVCANPTVLNAPFVTCNSCNSFVSLLTTIVHECRHGTQKIAQNNECEAYTYAAAFIRGHSQQICMRWSPIVPAETCNNA